jgi:hypothetical protein
MAGEIPSLDVDIARQAAQGIPALPNTYSSPPTRMRISPKIMISLAKGSDSKNP